MSNRAAEVRAWEVIASILGERVAPQPADMELVAEIASTHRFEPPLGDPALAVGPGADRLRGRWQAAHDAALGEAVVRHGRIREVLAALDPLPVILTKGFAAAELIYPSPGARGMGDVDLLVTEKSLEDCLSRLVPLGYRKQFAGHPVLDHPRFHERQLVGPLNLDLHQAFIQPARLPIDYADVFARAVPWPALAPNARLLAPEDAFVYTAVHLAIGELTPEWAPAIGFLDLREMLRRTGPLWGFGPRLDLGLVAARATEWHAERMLFVAAEALCRLFPSTASGVAALVPTLPRAVARLLRASIIERAVPPSLASPHRAEVLFRKALFLRPADRLRFAASALAQRFPR